ncbi:THUMP domain-containing protein [Balneolaceae bacterium ANBcel3]|nr:THUMP domain-containing protein [Balneolaceae bacterium ANBcel3]
MSFLAASSIPVFVKTLMGLEEVLADELKTLGAEDLHIGTRGVACTVSEEVLYRLLIHSRLAIRILIRINESKIQNEQELYDWVRTIDWHDYFSLKHSFAFDVVSFHSQMNHTVFLAQKAKDAIVDQFRDRYAMRPNVSPKDPDLRINLHISNDGSAHLGLDASGRSMNQRGYRQGAGKAAINEVLAAGLISLSLWDPETPFVDIMCGSGTFAIEAALIAKNRAPALNNDSFGIKRWPLFRASLWKRLMDEARRSEKRGVDWIYGNDIDPRTVDVFRKNVRAARLSKNIRISNLPFQKMWIPEGNGTIISNPPYGDHIGDRNELKKMYEELGQVLKYKAQGYKAYFITPDKRFKETISLKHGKIFHVLNGATPCEFISYSIGPKKQG